MICLGIESTAHTFGVGIIDAKGKVYANERSVFVTKKGGMIPAEVAEFHVEHFSDVIVQALEKAGMTMKNIDVIAYSQSPGIGHCLRIGAMAARTLAIHHNKPLVNVNHCIAHLEIGNILTESTDPVLLYASGANTQIIAYDGGKYRIFGETLDIGIGNFIDSFARHIGLGFPGGPKVYELSLKAKKYVELPYCVKGMDISLGGILTNLKHKFKLINEGKADYTVEDLCHSLQETSFAMLLEVSERALAHCEKKELLLGGGVACNIRLQKMARQMCEARGAKCFALEREFNVDNGAMIAWVGILMHGKGLQIPIAKAGIEPYLRTDDIQVVWRE